MRRLVLTGLLVAAPAARLAGYPGLAGLLLCVAVLVWQVPQLHASRAVLRSWLGDEPLFPYRPPAEELPRAYHRAP